MASPQLEDGFTRIANELLEEIAKRIFNAHHLRVLLVILRLTYGFGRKDAVISAGDLARRTGMDRSHCRRAVSELAAARVVRKQPHLASHLLGINKDYEQWKVGRKLPHRGQISLLGAGRNLPPYKEKGSTTKKKNNSSPPKEGEHGEKFDYPHAIDRYRAFAKKVGAPGCSDWPRWDEARKRKFRAQAKKADFDWEKILLAAYDSPFIRESIDEGKTWFKIDFLLQAKSWPILLEGGYGQGYVKQKQQEKAGIREYLSAHGPFPSKQ